MNAYDMLAELRDNVNEASASHWTDAALLRKLNIAQKKIGLRVAMAPGDWLVTYEDLTPSSSLITIPSTCAKPVYMEEVSSGNPIYFRTDLRDRRMTRQLGSSLASAGAMEAYLTGKYIEVNQADYATQIRLWYQRRLPDLHTGTANAGGAAQLDLDTTDGADSSGHGGKAIDDYYNDVAIEIVSGTGIGYDTITDFTASDRRCTVTGTYSTDSVYGTVPWGIPPEGHGVIILEATCLALAKPSSAMDQDAKDLFVKLKREAWSEFNDWISTRVPGSGHTRITSYE